MSAKHADELRRNLSSVCARRVAGLCSGCTHEPQAGSE
jgi:hypothetical protein